jgi:hypothetical protein
MMTPTQIQPIPVPPPYPKVVRELSTVNKEGWEEIDGFRLRKNKDVIFQKGFQEAIQTCEADVIFSGGSASAGKTYAILMEAMRGLGRQNYSALIVKKELVEVGTAGGILSDARRIYRDMQGCEYSASDYSFKWDSWNSSIMLTHINLQGEAQEREAQEKMKNKQASYIAIDELTNFTFKVWKYWFSRNRDTSGVRPKMICTMNANGWHFSHKMLSDAGFIGDDNYVKPEMVGKLMYFVIQGETEDDIIWANSKEEMKEKLPDLEKGLTPEMIRDGLTPENLIKSFTFIPGNIMDNRIMTFQTGGGNVANLFNVGEAERMKLLYGYWGEMNEGESMVLASEVKNMFFGERQNAIQPDTTGYMTVDLGSGGDPSRAYVWRGLSVIAMRSNYTSDAPEKVSWVKGIMQEFGIPPGRVAVDTGGVGDYFDTTLKGVVGIVSNRSPLREYDEAGNLITLEQYVFIRDQLCGKLAAYMRMGKIRYEFPESEVVIYGRRGAQSATIGSLLMTQCMALLKRFETAR